MRELVRGLAAMVRLAFEADRRRSLLVFVLQPASGAQSALTALLMGGIVDAVLTGDRSGATTRAAVLVVLGLVGLTSSMLGFSVVMRLRERIDLLVDQKLIELTSGIPGIEHLESPEHLDRLELLRTNRAALGSVVHAIALNLMAMISVVATAAVLFRLHPLMLLVPLGAVPNVVIAGRNQRRIEAVNAELAEPQRRMLHLFDVATTAGAGKELRTFGLIDDVAGRYRDLQRDLERRKDRVRWQAEGRSAVGWLVYRGVYLAATLLVVSEAAAGRASVGDVVTAIAIAGDVSSSVGMIADMARWMRNSLETVGRYLWLVDRAAAGAEQIDDPATPPDVLADGICLDHVSFRYPGTDRLVLDDVSLRLPAGSTVAVVGDNGAGKTTLVKLLSRYYEPSGGSITVDGIPLERIPVADWRARMSGGFQDFARLEVVARESIGVGQLEVLGDAHADDAADEVVSAAAGRAAATDVIEALPEGLGTMLGPAWGGEDLSGGQWQKVALGRAMMRERPLLLVLDEPTAALDADAEHALFERYAAASRDVSGSTGGITLLVSHRFSTVRMADLIVVIDAGGVAEAGTHDQLMATNGLYAELYELQARQYR